MKTALVTGASGFIGRKLCERLRAEGVRVVALTGRTAPEGPWDECHGVDISDGAAVASLAGKIAGPVDVVFHLAGKAHDHDAIGDAAAFDAVNVSGTANTVALARKVGAQRFVLAGSVAAMGVSDRLCAEADMTPPSSAYGKSKLASERTALSAAEIGPVVLRFPLVYGGKERGNMTRMVSAIMRNRFPPFPETGNRRCMVHVDDVISAFLLAASHTAAPGGTFIVTDGRFYSTREIYLIIRGALGKGIPVFTPPIGFFRGVAKVGDILGKLAGRRMPLDSDSLEKLSGSSAFDSTLIRQKLGFVPSRTLEDGILTTIRELDR